MFNRYWREYPWYFQLVQYILFLFIFGSLFTGVIAPLVAQRIPNETTRLWVLAGIPNLGTFAIPALLFAYLVHPQPLDYLGLRRPGRSVHWLLVVAVMLGAMPLMLALAAAMNKLDFGKGAGDIQKAYTETMRKLSDLRTVGQLALAIIVTGIIAPIGEEMMFRSILLRFTARRARHIVFPILLTAVMFSLFHFSNVQGLLPIALMGVLLALIVYWTGSLWCSIFGHFLFNVTQVLAMYFSSEDARAQMALEQEAPPLPLLLTGAVIFILGLVGLYRLRTPLPRNWAADFSSEEIAARENERQRLS